VKTSNQWRFDRKLARLLAAYSSLAYKQVTESDPLTDASVLIQEWNGHTILAFQGTKDIREWLDDADFDQKAIAYGVKVHHGFLRCIDALLPKIIARLLPKPMAVKDTAPLLVCGHSLGGALASLAADFMAGEGFDVRGVYTFASPRVGNARWRDDYNARLGDRSFRVVRAGDLVPHVPFGFGYRHVGREVLIAPNEIWVNPSPLWETLACWLQTMAALRRGDLNFIVKYHSINDSYQPLL